MSNTNVRYGIIVLNYPSIGVNCWCSIMGHGSYTSDVNVAYRIQAEWNQNNSEIIYIVKEFDESKVVTIDGYNTYKE